jgi:AraC-like DNA-binding protein
VRGRPAPALRRFVAGYEGYREAGGGAGGGAVVRRETPIPRFPVILNFGEGFAMRPDRAGAAWRLERASFVAGLHDHAVLVRAEGRAACVQFDLTPPGARRVLGIDLDAIGGAVVPVEDILGAAARRLVARLADAPGWAARFALLDAFLLERVAGARPEAPAIAAAWSLMARTGGRVGVQALAARAGLSRQGLGAGFRREVGIAPKAAARILRVDRAVGMLQAAPGLGLAEVALACGYSDQPHLAREMRALCGESPAALRARLLPDGTGLMTAG